METEIKLSPVSAHTAGQVFGDPLLVPFLGDARRTDMESIYYTDREGALARAGAALRLRRENGDGVCCLKIKAGRQGLADVRQEFEIPAEDVGEGAYRLSRLPPRPLKTHLSTRYADAISPAPRPITARRPSSSPFPMT